MLDATSTPRLLTTQAFADQVGVTKATVLRWIGSGYVAHVRIGRRYRIPATEVGRLLEVQPARAATG